MRDQIEKKLKDNFTVMYLEVVNESAKHQGHAGDDGSGESHFYVKLISPDFKGVNRIDRQRKIFNALDSEMKIIHALSLDIKAE